MTVQNMNALSRRYFLKNSAAVGLGISFPTRSLLANSANEQVNLGIIGCGWRGGDLAKYFSQTAGVKVAGLCDVDQKLVDKLGEAYPQAEKWIDMRRMFDSKEIDAVAIATCNHWHCLAAIWAMEAGKHVYVEKPLGHNEWEGRQVVLAQSRTGKVCQIGTQQRSDPMQAEIKHFLHEEKAIGEIESVRVNRFGERKPIGKRAKPLVPPSSVDYDLWLGPAADEPLYRDKLHYDWHWDFNTGSGEMGNWGVHILDDVRNNVFRDKVTAPNSIIAAGTRAVWGDAGNTPNTHLALLDAGGIPVAVALSNLSLKGTSVKVPGPRSGYVVNCSAGRLEGQRGMAVAFDADGKKLKSFKGNGGNPIHQRNFIEAVRAENQDLLVAPVSVGNDSTTWCNLINVATRIPVAQGGNQQAELGATIGEESMEELLLQMNGIIQSNGGSEVLQLGTNLEFDVQQARFVGAQSSEANQFLKREYRDSFRVPDYSESIRIGSR